MTDKTKKILKCVCCGLVVAGCAGAILLGVTVEELKTGVVIAGACVTAVAAVVSWIIK